MARVFHIWSAIIYIITQRPAFSQSLITEETNTHNEGRRNKYLNINCHSQEKAKGMTGEMNGALLIFFLFQIAKTPFTACQNLITE